MDPDFYDLSRDGRVLWTRLNASPSYAHYRYEIIGGDALVEKIGVMPHGARLEFLGWLKTRYG
jgi:hypothetical protein